MRVMFIVNDLGVNEPFGPMILSSVLRAKGHQTTLGVIKKEDVETKIRAWKPDMLAYSMMSVDMADMKRFNDRIRQTINLFTLLGGAHATLNRNCISDPYIDAICVGEGEDAIVDIVNNLEQGKSVQGIPNIMTRDSSSLVLRELIEDFDAYPFMDRGLVYAYPEMARFGIKGIWTSRGCVFPCPYCFNNRQNTLFANKGRVFRRRSVDAVIRETRELIARHRVDFVRIQDDVFVHRADEWLKDFSGRWASEIRLPFYCLLRAELITDEMAHYLKQAGCFSICMSIEAANDDIRVRMMRRRVTKAQLAEAFRILKKHRINVYSNTMFALPFTTLEHDVESLDFAIAVKPEMPNFSIFMPYPGTDLGDYCKDAGIYDSDEEDITYGMRNMSPLKCFTQEEKKAQYNLCQLAIVAVKFPYLRNLIVNTLIYWKPNKLFFLILYMFSVTSYGRKIFYFKHSLKEYVELIIKTLKHYLYDYTKGDKKTVVVLHGSHKGSETQLDINKRRAELEKCMKTMAACKVYGSL